MRMDVRPGKPMHGFTEHFINKLIVFREKVFPERFDVRQLFGSRR